MRELLSLIDGPLDVAHQNVVDVEFLRATTPQAVTSAALGMARPSLLRDWRGVYQSFTNSATTIITVLPACRRSRGIDLKKDPVYQKLAGLLPQLVTAYESLGHRFANVATLIKQIADQLLPATRHAASELLANLYG